MRRMKRNKPTEITADCMKEYGKSVQQIKSICTLQNTDAFYFSVIKYAISLAMTYIQQAGMSFLLFHLFLIKIFQHVEGLLLLSLI